jgi:hypothetical protein
MIRSFFPLDTVDIIFQGKSLSNKAKTKDSVVREETALANLADLLGQWFNPRARSCVWVCTEGFALRGLASVKDRRGSRAWEIDRLLLREQDGDCCLSLLEHVGLAGAELAVETVFLRLPDTSPLLDVAKKAGFLPYVTERLYWLEKGEVESGVPDRDSACVLSPRRRQADDEYRLFELYEKCVPPLIRRVEGATLAQWKAYRDRSTGQEWVFEKDGSLVGWMAFKSERGMGQFEVVAASDGELEQVMEYGLTCLSGCRHLYCLAPEFEHALCRQLECRGFSQISGYSAFARDLAVKAEEPCLMPVRA